MDYQTLINGVFVCGLSAVPNVIEKEGGTFVIDLRAEAHESPVGNNLNWVNIL